VLAKSKGADLAVMLSKIADELSALKSELGGG
jgi:hypothetical protein